MWISGARKKTCCAVSSRCVCFGNLKGQRKARIPVVPSCREHGEDKLVACTVWWRGQHRQPIRQTQSELTVPSVELNTTLTITASTSPRCWCTSCTRRRCPRYFIFQIPSNKQNSTLKIITNKSINIFSFGSTEMNRCFLKVQLLWLQPFPMPVSAGLGASGRRKRQHSEPRVFCFASASWCSNIMKLY